MQSVSSTVFCQLGYSAKSQLNSQLLTAAEQHKSLQTELEAAAKVAVGQEQAATAKLHAELRTLRSNLSAAQQAAAASKEEAEQQQQSLQSQLDTAQQQAAAQREKLDSAQKACQKLQTQLQETQSKAENTQQQLTDAEAVDTDQSKALTDADVMSLCRQLSRQLRQPLQQLMSHHSRPRPCSRSLIARPVLQPTTTQQPTQHKSKCEACRAKWALCRSKWAVWRLNLQSCRTRSCSPSPFKKSSTPSPVLAALRKQLQLSKAAAQEAQEVSSTLQSELKSAQELCNMHKSKADAAQRQIRSLQSQLQSKQEQLSLLESELADSVAQAEHEMSPAEPNLVSHADLAALHKISCKADLSEMQSQAADLKSELEAAQQLSLSHQGYAESSRMQIRSLHSHLTMLQHQHDDLQQQLADAQSARQQVLHSLDVSCTAWKCEIQQLQHQLSSA